MPALAARILAVETRTSNYTFPVGGVRGWEFTNVGAHVPWLGARTKPVLLLARLEAENEASPGRDAITILADTDIVFGGCTTEELLGRYHDTVAASGGAPVLLGAENGLWPPEAWSDHTVALYRQFRGRREAVLRRFGLNGTAYRGTYRYLNFGFMMGPVRLLLELLRFVVARLPGHDQLAAMRYMFRFRHLVTLDYSGSIVLSMFPWRRASVLEVRRGVVVNRVAKLVQCFVHYNGPEEAKEELRSLTSELG